MYTFQHINIVQQTQGKISTIKCIFPFHTPDKYVTVKDAIGNLPPLIAGSTDPNDLMHSATALSEKKFEAHQTVYTGGNMRDWDKELQLKCHKRVQAKHILLFMGECGGMLHHLLLQRSFMAMEMGVLAIRPKIVHCHYEKALFCNHFPKDYKFIRSTDILNKRKLGLQIGNAVPVRLGKVIGLSIFRSYSEVQ